MIESSRRGFITGLGSLLITAPAIVRAASIMPVKAIDVGMVDYMLIADFHANVRANFGGHAIAVHMAELTKQAFLPSEYMQILNQSPWMQRMLAQEKMRRYV